MTTGLWRVPTIQDVTVPRFLQVLLECPTLRLHGFHRPNGSHQSVCFPKLRIMENKHLIGAALLQLGGRNIS